MDVFNFIKAFTCCDFFCFIWLVDFTADFHAFVHYCFELLLFLWAELVFFFERIGKVVRHWGLALVRLSRFRTDWWFRFNPAKDIFFISCNHSNPSILSLNLAPRWSNSKRLAIHRPYNGILIINWSRLDIWTLRIGLIFFLNRAVDGQCSFLVYWHRVLWLLLDQIFVNTVNI